MFRDEYAVAPVGQSFHPEFGYLCPSAGLRRRLGRVAKLVLVALAVAGGAAFGLSSALLTPPAGEAARVATAVAQVPATVETKAGEPKTFEIKTFEIKTFEIKTFEPNTVASKAVEPAVAPSTERTATVSGEAALAHAQAACDDASLSFLSPQCRPGRKSHSAHSPSTSRLATVTLGRVDAPRAAEPHKAAERAPADKSAKKPLKTAQEHVPIRANARVSTAAPAPASPAAFNLLGLFHNLPRLANNPFRQFLQ